MARAWEPNPSARLRAAPLILPPLHPLLPASLLPQPPPLLLLPPPLLPAPRATIWKRPYRFAAELRLELVRERRGRVRRRLFFARDDPRAGWKLSLANGPLIRHE